MSYITQEDLKGELGEEKLIQLTDDAQAGAIGEARVSKAISYAVGTFESYARSRYTLPVPVTEVVKARCLDLAVFHLYKGRPVNDPKQGVYAVKKEAHDQAIAWLKDLSMGKAALDVPSAEETETNPASPDQVLRGSSTKPEVFSDEKLSGY